MSTQQTSRSLREVLATNSDLRHKMRQAAALAAYNVIKDAGITVTAADIADAQADIAAMTIPLDAMKKDTLSDVATLASAAATIATLAGF